MEPPLAQTPETAPAATPETAPAATPETAPAATPETAPAATPETAPAVTPTPATASEISPQKPPETAPVWVRNSHSYRSRGLALVFLGLVILALGIATTVARSSEKYRHIGLNFHAIAFTFIGLLLLFMPIVAVLFIKFIPRTWAGSFSQTLLGVAMFFPHLVLLAVVAMIVSLKVGFTARTQLKAEGGNMKIVNGVTAALVASGLIYLFK